MLFGDVRANEPYRFQDLPQAASRKVMPNMPEDALQALTRVWRERGFDPFAFEADRAERRYWRYLWSVRDQAMREGGQRRTHLRKLIHPRPRFSSVADSRRLTLEDALNRLERVRPKANGTGWTAICPVHEDRTPSLLVMESEKYPGEAYFHCSAGCDMLAIVNALKSR